MRHRAEDLKSQPVDRAKRAIDMRAIVVEIDELQVCPVLVVVMVAAVAVAVHA